MFQTSDLLSNQNFNGLSGHLQLLRLTNPSVSMDQLDSLVIPFHLYFLPGNDLPSECPPCPQPGVCPLAEIKTAEQ